MAFSYHSEPFGRNPFTSIAAARGGSKRPGHGEVQPAAQLERPSHLVRTKLLFFAQVGLYAEAGPKPAGKDREELKDFSEKILMVRKQVHDQETEE